jgi:hypothetical protein
VSLAQLVEVQTPATTKKKKMQWDNFDFSVFEKILFVFGNWIPSIYTMKFSISRLTISTNETNQPFALES